MMKKIIYTVLFFLAVISFAVPGGTLRKKVLESIKAFYNTYPIEKVYVHTDKPYYVAGETIWFKSYLVDGMTHKSTVSSGLYYVELIGPKGRVVRSVTLNNTSWGVAGDFALPDQAEGKFILRGYTQSMRNFPDQFIFQREIRVFPLGTDVATVEEVREDVKDHGLFEINFFPEGGELVGGLPAKVGFKAVGLDGNGVDVEGKLVDEGGHFITVMKTMKWGLGFFSFTPEADKDYKVEIISNGVKKEVPLPEVIKDGYTMHYIRGNGQSFQVMLQSSDPKGLQGALLYGHVRGRSFVAETIEGEKDKAVFKISTDSLSEGVAHLTLFKSDGIPVCERLIFISHANRRGNVAIQADQPTYRNRDKVKLNLRAFSSDQDNVFGGADLSVGVTDQSLVSHEPYGIDIRAYLLLSSEIRGRIEQPSYYFDPSNRGAELLLDLLMMTQGWRRFDWDQILEEDLPTVPYTPEESFTISGQITKLGDDEKPVKARVFFNTLDENFLFAEVTTTEDGKFAFTGINFADTTSIILKAQRYRETSNDGRSKDSPVSSKTRDRFVSIRLDQRVPPQIDDTWTIPFYDKVQNVNRYVETHRNIAKIDSSYRQLSVDLDAVTISARRINKKEQERQVAQLYSRPDQRLVVDSLGSIAVAYQSIFDLIQSRFAGVQVQGVYPNQQAIIRGYSSVSGSNEARFVLDGVMISNEGVNNIPVQDIDYIDVLKSGATAAIFGSFGANGIIAIYTKKGASAKQNAAERPRLGILDYDHPGYYRARKFYQPNYDQKLPAHSKPDFRTTLYWNPSVIVDEKGGAQLEFFCDDKRSTYQVDVQGVARDGTPLVGRATFVVE